MQACPLSVRPPVPTPFDDVTADIRSSASEQDVAAIVALVYEQLRTIAHLHMRAERGDHTLSTTALVHEAYVRLSRQTRARWREPAHFCAFASRVMRRVLVDHARQHRALKRGGGDRISLDIARLSVDEQAQSLLELDEALTRLGELDQRQVTVVECRFFAGMSEEETAGALGVTTRTVRRDWIKAKAWLLQELSETAS